VRFWLARHAPEIDLLESSRSVGLPSRQLTTGVRGPIPTLLKTKLAKIAVDKGANTDYNLGHNER
jgi:hypothetical protein